MATHSSVLTWEIPWAGEPGRLQSMGLQRVEHGLSDFTFFLSFICHEVMGLDAMISFLNVEF